MVTISLFSMYYGMILLKTGQLTETKLFFQQIAKKGFSSKIALASNYMKGLMSRPDHIYIDIKHNDYQIQMMKHLHYVVQNKIVLSYVI